MNLDHARLTLDAPADYRICVQGQLGVNLADYFDGINVEEVRNGNGHPKSVLRGIVADQAALTGLLCGLVDWGYSLISVECVGVPECVRVTGDGGEAAPEMAAHRR